MAKGLFSWLGFGRKKEEAEAVPSQAPDATTVIPESEASVAPAPVAETPPTDAQPDAFPTTPDEGPLVVEECESELEPVIVNEALIADEA
ncbi:MAG: signal recognition particle-docking protein FtsY, partial [Aeromonas sp.]